MSVIRLLVLSERIWLRMGPGSVPGHSKVHDGATDHGYLQRLAAPWAMFNVMPGLCGIRGGEGQPQPHRNSIEMPGCIWPPNDKRGHQTLHVFQLYTNFQEMQMPWGTGGEEMPLREKRKTRTPMMQSLQPRPGGNARRSLPRSVRSGVDQPLSASVLLRTPELHPEPISGCCRQLTITGLKHDNIIRFLDNRRRRSYNRFSHRCDFSAA